MENRSIRLDKISAVVALDEGLMYLWNVNTDSITKVQCQPIAFCSQPEAGFQSPEGFILFNRN